MRITNLHLIVSFFILSAFGFIAYRHWRSVTPQASAIRSYLQNKYSESLNTTAYVEQARQRTRETLERALDALQTAMSRDSRVAGPFIGYRRAKNLYDEAVTAEDYANARSMAEDVIQQLSGRARMTSSTGGSMAVGPMLNHYVVRRGDNLWNIAKKPEVYGRGSGWVRIWRANEMKVPDFDILISGQELKIPR